MPKEKTMHDLAKEFPEKKYSELEKYREEDRKQEAHRIPLTESQQKQEELEPIVKGACVIGEARKDREENPPNQPTQLIDFYRQKAADAQKKNNELLLEMKAADARIEELQDILNRVKEENNDLFNRIADAMEVNESHQKLNGKLQERVTELEEENKKLHAHVEKQVTGARQSGM